ncbi:hypothetical protein C8A01DRAFT_18738 [Parachaetomium inaequale]|uniref:Uncharacterized protein n=1 Tax=Parachaetomium inaequale TaxID=2588326 RepID=A0AAN6P9Y7_9PEZI|nr:hypothetical protein C8A01DRAFT_18738 [Parachaetomium inaequale]
MMFKTATILAVAAALMPNVQAAAVDSSLDARQNRPCPVNGQACGWYLLNGADRPCTCTTNGALATINGTVDIFDSIWQVTNSVPVALVRECRTVCSNQGDRPNTVCNEDI